MRSLWSGIGMGFLQNNRRNQARDSVPKLQQMKLPTLILIAAIAGCSSTQPAPVTKPQIVSVVDQMNAKATEWTALVAKQQAYYANLPWSGPGRQAWRDLDTETVALNKMRAFYDAHPTDENAQAYFGEVNRALKLNYLKHE